MESRTSIMKYWFCRNCNKPFELTPWSYYKEIAVKDLCCPFCNSQSITFSSSLTKAIIEKQSLDKLLNVIAVDDLEMKKILDLIKNRQESIEKRLQ